MVATGRASDFGCHVDDAPQRLPGDFVEAAGNQAAIDEAEFTFDCGGVEAESATSQLTRSVRPDVPSGSSANGRFFLNLPVCHCPSFVEQNQRTDCATKDVPIKRALDKEFYFQVYLW